MPDSSTTVSRAVFLSYAREDAEPVRRIADALRAFGVEVWFDQNELRGGDAWDSKIRAQIRACTLCVPVISAATQARGEGYFRREWKIAVERTHDMAAGVPFLLPVVIDETPESAALVPDEFMRVQWTRLPKGVPTPQFVEQVKKLLEGKPTGSAQSRPAGRSEVAPPTAKSPIPGWLWGTAAAVIVAVVAGVLLLRKTEPSAPPASAAAAVPEAKPATFTVPLQHLADKSIAVLPFTNMSEDKDASAFFSDGIHEDILTNLALIRELRVVSRTSVMQYRDTKKTMKQIAQELGVTYILEGSVRRSGNKVRVTGQLIHAATDEHVWAKNYDRDLTDIFSIQSALATEIAGALSAALSPQEKQLLDRRPTDNLAAYDNYMKARQLREMTGSQSINDAVTLLQAAVKLDSKFSAAWAALGATHVFIYFSSVDQTAERLAQAKAAIDTAVSLAPDDPEVIEMVGDYYYYGFRDYTRAVEQYQRLAVLRPNDGAVFSALGLIHRRQGRWQEALIEFRRAAQLEPRSVRYVRFVGESAKALCLYTEAYPAMRRSAELADHEPVAEADAAFVPFLAGGSTKAWDEWLAQMTPEQQRTLTLLALRKQWARTIGDFAGFVELDRQQRYADILGEAHGTQDANAALVFAALGDQSAARARAMDAVSDLKAQLEKQPANEILWSSLGLAHALLGERAEALRCAQKAKDLVSESKDALVGPFLSLNYAWCLARLGEKDQALAELARLLRTPWGENIYLAKAGAGWFPLRDDPRFRALVNDPKNNTPLF